MNEVRHALRQLTRRPGLSIVIVIMLALGIGSTTAIFSLFQEVLLRPLPVPQPSRLVNLDAPGPRLMGSGSTLCGDEGPCTQIFSYPMFQDLERSQKVFTGIAGSRDFQANIAYAGKALTGKGLLVSGDYFHVLELRPALGRLIGPQDEPEVGESSVAVLSYAYWRTRFGGDYDVVGRTLLVNGRQIRIVGVAPEGFSGTTIGIRPQVFVPLTLRWDLQPTIPRNDQNRTAYWLYLFARLKPGLSIEQAAAGINNVYSGITNAVEVPLLSHSASKAFVERFRQRRIKLQPGARGQSEIPAKEAQPLTLLLGVTTLVLLIVCVNVATLLLARGAARAGELAVRASMGASAGRLMRASLIEAGMLAIVGGIMSLPIAAATLGLITAMLPAAVAKGLVIELNSAALLFATAVSVATVLLFGLVPALQARAADPGPLVKGQVAQSGGGRGTARFRSTLATVQITFSMVLLVLAGLFVRSLVNVARVNLGMNVDSLVTFALSPRLNGDSPVQAERLFDRVRMALAAQPGVSSVASAVVPLIADASSATSVSIPGGHGDIRGDHNAMTDEVSPGFFRTLSIPLLGGRDFTNDDNAGSRRVAIVNQSFLRKFGLGDVADAIGRHFIIPSPKNVEIVGVVADAKYAYVKGADPPQYFVPRRQNDNPISRSLGSLSFYVRSAIAPRSLFRVISHVVKQIDPTLPVQHLMTMRRQVNDRVFLDRLVGILSAAFAALATLLAAIGLYGVLTYNVTQRTRELGLRLALGATPGRLRAMVLKQVSIITLVGGVVGLVAGIALGRASAALLYGLKGYDPSVLAVAAVILAVVVLAAGYVPVRRASRVEPMQALRHE